VGVHAELCALARELRLRVTTGGLRLAGHDWRVTTGGSRLAGHLALEVAGSLSTMSFRRS